MTNVRRTKIAPDDALSVIAEIGHVVNSTLEIDEALGEFARLAKKLIPYDRITVATFNADRTGVVFRYAEGDGIDVAEVGDEMLITDYHRSEDPVYITVFEEKKTFIKSGDDYAHYQKTYPGESVPYQAGFRSVMFVPLIWRDEVVGGLGFRSFDPDAYQDHEMELTLQVANQVAGAFANSIAHERIEGSEQQSRIIAEIGRVVNSTVNIDEVLAELARLSQQLVPYDRIAISTFNDDRSSLLFRFISGIEFADAQVGNELVITEYHRNEDPVYVTVYENKKPFSLGGEDYASYQETNPSESTPYSIGFRSVMFVPLLWQGEVIGGLGFRSFDPNAFGNDELEMAEHIADQVAGAFAVSMAHDRLARSEQESKAIADLSVELASAESAVGMYQAMDAMLLEFFDFDRISFITVDQSLRKATQVYQRGVMVPGLATGDDLHFKQSFHEFEIWANELIGTDVDSYMVADDPLVTHKQLGLISRMRAPIVTKTGFVGVIALNHKEAHKYSEADHRFLKRAVLQLGPALEKALLHERLEEQAHDLEVQLAESQLFADISRAMSDNLDSAQLFDSLANELEKLLPFDRLVISQTVNGKRQVLVTRGIHVEEAVPGSIVEPTYTDESRMVLLEDLPLSQDNPLELALVAAGLRSRARGRIVASGELIGTISAVSKQRGAYSQYHAQLLERVCALVAPVLKNAMTYEETVRLASDLAESESKLVERTDQLLLVSEIVDAISSIRDRDQLADRLRPLFASVLPSDTWDIRLVDSDGTNTVAMTSRDFSDPHTQDVLRFTYKGSVTEYVITSKQGILIHSDDSPEILNEFPSARFEPDSSSVATPLIDAGEAIGILRFTRIGGKRFTQTDLETAKQLGDHIASSIGSRALLEKTADLTSELQVYSEFSEAIATIDDIEQLGHRLSELLLEMVEAGSFGVGVVDFDNEVTRMVMSGAAEFGDGYRIGDETYFGDGTISKHIFDTREIVSVSRDDFSSVREKFPSSHFNGEYSGVFLPLMHSGECVAFFSLVNDSETGFSEEDIRRIDGLANHIAGSVSNWLLRQELAEQAERERLAATIGRVIAGQRSVAEMGHALADELRDATGYDFLFLNEKLAEDESVRMRYRRRYDAEGEVVQDGAGGVVQSVEGRIVGRVIESEAPCHVRFESVEEVDAEFPGRRDVGFGTPLGFSCVPLFDRGVMIGMLQLNYLDYEAADRRAVTILEAVAPQVAAVFATLLIQEQTERALMERQVLVSIGSEISGINVPENVGEMIIRQLQKVSQFSALQAVSIDPVSMTTDVWASYPQDDVVEFSDGSHDWLTHFVDSMKVWPKSLALTLEQIQASAEEEPDSSWSLRMLNRSGLAGLVVCPMFIGGGVVGAILLGFEDSDDMEPGLPGFMDEVASIISAAVENSTLRDELANRVELRTAELQEANEQLESFVYTVSHDLRGPIRTSEAYSNIVLEEFSDVLPENASKYIELTRRSAIHLGELVEDLLQFSRLGRVQPVMDVIDVQSLVARLVAELGYDSDSSVEFVVGDLPEVRGDATLLESLFSNLIGNAAKFSAPVSAPRVEVFAEDGSGSVVYRVRDNGVGFDTAHAAKIFGVFERLHSSAEFEGTGVGLAIVHKVVERHGGRIWFDSEVGKGTTFSFTLQGEGKQN